MTPRNLTILLAAAAAACASAFAPAPRRVAGPAPPRPARLAAEGTAAERAAEVDVEPQMNPDNPNLPALKGDYDWDAAYAADDDWITEDVPGKVVLNDVALAAQATALSSLEDGYRRARKREEYEDARLVGFVGTAEMYNGRFAMFFLVVGLLTEYWTGISIPGQIEEMARVGGFIGPDF